MGRLDDKVAIITGVARGLGRSAAVRLAQEGARIVGLDICSDIASVQYEMASPDDLRETVRLVEAVGGRIDAFEADVRDQAALHRIAQHAIETYGRLDIVSVNHGIASFGRLWEVTDEQWDDMIGINLTGVFTTIRAVVPRMIEAGNGGAIVLMSSVGGIRGLANVGPYVATKHALNGMTKTLANEVGPYGIRVNALCPGNVETAMVLNQAFGRFIYPNQDHVSAEEIASALRGVHVFDIPWVSPDDISNALLYLVSDEGRYVTGVALPVDGGTLIKG
jgi:(+)-trans-carveol dehydrogenase